MNLVLLGKSFAKSVLLLLIINRVDKVYHKDIKEAFKSKKSGIQNNQNNFKKPSSLAIASQRIFNLESKNRLLEEENRNLKQQFVLWQYNAYKHNINKNILDEPLPPIDRGRSDRKLI